MNDHVDPLSHRPGPPPATRREWAGLAVIALPCMLYSMDLTVLNLAVPAISADLQPSASQLLWIIDIYGFMVAGWLITMGNLGDRIGRRRLLMIGAGAFGVASMLAAFASSAGMLIALRALLGVAGATLAPSTLSLIRGMFQQPAQRTVAVGVWISSYSVGAAIGPLVGGALLEHFWWGSVFLINVPVMVLLLGLGPWLLPEFRDAAPRRLDATSVLQSIAAVLLTVYGCKQIAEDGFGWLALGCGVVGIGVGIAFLRRQRLLAEPLIDLRLLRIPQLRIALVTYSLGCFVMFGAFIFVAQHLQGVLGLAPFDAGLWTVPWALAFVVGSLLTPVLVSKAGSRATIVGGLLLAAIACAVLAWAAQANTPVAIATATVLLSLGLAPVFTLATDLVIGAAPPERAGSAAAISETTSEFGGALGIALFGSIGTVLYRQAMQRADGGSFDLDSEPALLDAARNTLGAAVEVAAGLPDPVAQSALLAAARAGFTDGMQCMAVVAAITMLGAAWVAARALPHNPRTG
ncbi:MAG: MFS transporter [Burkholderiaceae bacterium]